MAQAELSGFGCCVCCCFFLSSSFISPLFFSNRIFRVSVVFFSVLFVAILSLLLLLFWYVRIIMYEFALNRATMHYVFLQHCRSSKVCARLFHFTYITYIHVRLKVIRITMSWHLLVFLCLEPLRKIRLENIILNCIKTSKHTRTHSVPVPISHCSLTKSQNGYDICKTIKQLTKDGPVKNLLYLVRRRQQLR